MNDGTGFLARLHHDPVANSGKIAFAGRFVFVFARDNRGLLSLLRNNAVLLRELGCDACRYQRFILFAGSARPSNSNAHSIHRLAKMVMSCLVKFVISPYRYWIGCYQTQKPQICIRG